MATQPDHGVFGVLHRCVLREATRAPLVALQWTFLVLIPALAAQCAIRLWVAQAMRAMRTARRGAGAGRRRLLWRPPRVVLGTWSYALLCPAGAVGGEGASWWLLLPPAFMLFRFVGHRFDACRRGRRAVAVVARSPSRGSASPPRARSRKPSDPFAPRRRRSPSSSRPSRSDSRTRLPCARRASSRAPFARAWRKGVG